jgi:hypothetical protein
MRHTPSRIAPRRAVGIGSAVSCLLGVGVELVAIAGTALGIRLPHWAFVCLFWLGIACLVLALALAVWWWMPALRRRGKQVVPPPAKPVSPATLAVTQRIGELGQAVATAEYLLRPSRPHVIDAAPSTPEEPGKRIVPGDG